LNGSFMIHISWYMIYTTYQPFEDDIRFQLNTLQPLYCVLMSGLAEERKT
jgi:hypothetical protein